MLRRISFESLGCHDRLHHVFSVSLIHLRYPTCIERELSFIMKTSLKCHSMAPCFDFHGVYGNSSPLIALFKLFLYAEIVALSPVQSSVSTSTDMRGCYYPDKTPSRGTPCRPNDAVSPCCGPGFVCLSNGLCSPGSEDRKNYQYQLYRSSCTDPTWNSMDCPQVCVGGES